MKTQSQRLTYTNLIQLRLRHRCASQSQRCSDADGMLVRKALQLVHGTLPIPSFRIHCSDVRPVEVAQKGYDGLHLVVVGRVHPHEKGVFFFVAQHISCREGTVGCV